MFFYPKQSRKFTVDTGCCSSCCAAPWLCRLVHVVEIVQYSLFLHYKLHLLCTFLIVNCTRAITLISKPYRPLYALAMICMEHMDVPLYTLSSCPFQRLRYFRPCLHVPHLYVLSYNQKPEVTENK